MRKYLVEHRQTEQDFSVYAQSPMDAVEKALIELKHEDMVSLFNDFHNMTKYLSGLGWYVYAFDGK